MGVVERGAAIAKIWAKTEAASGYERVKRIGIVQEHRVDKKLLHLKQLFVYDGKEKRPSLALGTTSFIF